MFINKNEILYISGTKLIARPKGMCKDCYFSERNTENDLFMCKCYKYGIDDIPYKCISIKYRSYVIFEYKKI